MKVIVMLNHLKKLKDSDSGSEISCDVDDPETYKDKKNANIKSV